MLTDMFLIALSWFQVFRPLGGYPNFMKTERCASRRSLHPRFRGVKIPDNVNAFSRNATKSSACATGFRLRTNRTPRRSLFLAPHNVAMLAHLAGQEARRDVAISGGCQCWHE